MSIASETEAGPRQVTFRIDHTMLPVSNLDASIAFYTEALGMRVLSMRCDEDAGRRAAHVGYGERGLFPTIELLELHTEDRLAPRLTGGGHIAVHVSDLAGLEAHLHDRGLQFVSPPAPGDRGLLAWLHDPDGHAIELLERR